MPFFVHTSDGKCLSSVRRADCQYEPLLEYIGEGGKSDLRVGVPFSASVTSEDIRHLLRRYVQHRDHIFHYQTTEDVIKSFQALKAAQDLGLHYPERLAEKLFQGGISLRLLDEAALRYGEAVPFGGEILRFAH